MLIARAVLAGAALLVGVITNLAGMQCFSVMIDEVNRKRQVQDMLSPFSFRARFAGWLWVQEVGRAYETAYPDGQLYSRYKKILAIVLVSFTVFFLAGASLIAVPR